MKAFAVVASLCAFAQVEGDGPTVTLDTGCGDCTAANARTCFGTDAKCKGKTVVFTVTGDNCVGATGNVAATTTDLSTLTVPAEKAKLIKITIPSTTTIKNYKYDLTDDANDCTGDTAPTKSDLPKGKKTGNDVEITTEIDIGNKKRIVLGPGFTKSTHENKISFTYSYKVPEPEPTPNGWTLADADKTVCPQCQFKDDTKFEDWIKCFDSQDNDDVCYNHTMTLTATGADGVTSDNTKHTMTIDTSTLDSIHSGEHVTQRMTIGGLADASGKTCQGVEYNVSSETDHKTEKSNVVIDKAGGSFALIAPFTSEWNLEFDEGCDLSNVKKEGIKIESIWTTPARHTDEASSSLIISTAAAAGLVYYSAF